MADNDDSVAPRRLSIRPRDWAIGLVLLAGLILWVHLQVGWSTLLAPWASLSAAELLGLLGLSLLSYLARGVRLYDYFPEVLHGQLWSTLRLSMLHNFANNLLPMRAGEAVFPLLMRRYFGHGLADSAFALLWIRLFDLHVLVLVALLAGWLARPGWLWPLLALLLLLALPLGYGLRGWLRHWAGSRPGRVPKLLARLLTALPADGGRFARAYLWTLITWACKFAAFTAVFLHFADVAVWQAIAGVIGAELSSVLPVHGVAGSGSYELALVAAIVPTGVDADIALAAAVNLHIFLLGVSLLLWPLALLLPRRSYRDSHSG